MDDALAVREGERVADFLEDGQERRVRILLRRRLGAAGEEVEPFCKVMPRTSFMV